MGTFYLYFSSCYGTFWLALMGIAFLTQSHVDAGEFGLFGFPILAAIFALFMVQSKKGQGGGRRKLEEMEDEIRALRRELSSLRGESY